MKLAEVSGKDGACVVLAAVDGGRTSLRAAAYAAGVARRQRAKLLFVYVQRTNIEPYFVDYSGAGFSLPRATGLSPQELRNEVLNACPVLDGQAEFLFPLGEPFERILFEARVARAEVIILGSPESLWHRWAGSLATRLLRANICPVTVVP
jgi:nucleotide-binding universal stress UspA family protein